VKNQVYSWLEQLIERHKAQFIDLGLVDLDGRLRRVTLPVSAIDPSIITEGVGFDGSSYGFEKVEASDMVMVPDLSTGHRDPFRAEPTLSFLATAHDTTPGLPQSNQDTRGILARALAYLRSTGLADEVLVAPEYEFYIFDRVEIDDATTSAGYRVTDRENDDGKAYHLSSPWDLHAGFRDEAVNMLVQFGMNVRYHHHEVGGHGQQEIESGLEPVVQAGDHAVMVRYLLKNLAHREGLQLTFMPKPLYKQAGNGWHVHQQVRKDGQNLFYDPKGEYGLSGFARSWIAGILTHGQALAGITNASTNSYRRLTRGFEAPVALTYGPADRTAAIRIPRWAQGEGTRIEYRAGDLTGNPYLSLAALIMAGIEGVEKGYDPKKRGFSPKMARSNVKTLPFSLLAALNALEEDHKFLTRGGVFPESLIANWLETKRRENDDVEHRPHPREFAIYFDL
jgi:glutamine synthetase